MTQPSMFDLADVTPKPTKPAAAPSLIAKWSASNTSAKCVTCQQSQHAGAAILARRANWKRTHPLDRDLLLCYSHAIPLRDADEAQARKVASRELFKRAR